MSCPLLFLFCWDRVLLCLYPGCSQTSWSCFVQVLMWLSAIMELWWLVWYLPHTVMRVEEASLYSDSRAVSGDSEGLLASLRRSGAQPTDTTCPYPSVPLVAYGLRSECEVHWRVGLQWSDFPESSMIIVKTFSFELPVFLYSSKHICSQTKNKKSTIMPSLPKQSV